MHASRTIWPLLPCPVFFVAPSAWQDHKRFLAPEELLASLCLPVSDRFARIAGVPKFPIHLASPNEQATMAGNGMSLPAVGAILLLSAVFVEIL